MEYLKSFAYFKIKTNNDDIFGLSYSCIIVSLQILTTDKVKSSHNDASYGKKKITLQLKNRTNDIEASLKIF